MTSILVIDDEPGIRATVRDILADEGYRVEVAEDAVVGLELLENLSPDLILLDIWLPRLGGIEALAELRKRRPGIEVVVISGHATIDMAVRTLKLGAFDFIEKPLSIDRLLSTCRNALSLVDLRKENKALRKTAAAEEDIIGDSIASRAIRDLIDQAADSEVRVLITGENGTGKELAARRIHRLSPRATKPFVAVNCAAIPETLIESELFGHEKGAFTDARARRLGRFEAADGGTLFLDEVADLSLAAQAKLLRALQEMTFERVGGEMTLHVDVRILAATNKDIRAEIAAGRFREDLYFRLAVVPINMPTLRERPGDIPLLARAFLGEGRQLSPEAAALLSARSWPGNARELRNAMERLRVLCDDNPIGAEAVDRVLGAASSGAARPKCDLPGRFLDRGLSDARELFERDYISYKLAENGYNVARTAEAVGAYPSGLHARIRKLGIETGK
ncbi:MAG: sigma-54-dependent transcriptional regulator [Rectinemataceae bacterium]